MKKIIEGDIVVFIGCLKEQINWGNNDDPNGILIKNNTYIVEKIEVHSYHTKLTLKGVNGKFNSVCFLKLEDE